MQQWSVSSCQLLISWNFPQAKIYLFTPFHYYSVKYSLDSFLLQCQILSIPGATQTHGMKVGRIQVVHTLWASRSVGKDDLLPPTNHVWNQNCLVHSRCIFFIIVLWGFIAGRQCCLCKAVLSAGREYSLCPIASSAGWEGDLCSRVFSTGETGSTSPYFISY